MFNESSILEIVKSNADSLGIAPSELGRIDELIAKSIYKTVTSREFIDEVSKTITQQNKHRAFGYGS